MANKPVHAVLAADEYAALVKASHEVGVHTSEIIREATISWIRDNFPEAERLLSAVKLAGREARVASLSPSRGFEARPNGMRPPARPD